MYRCWVSLSRAVKGKANTSHTNSKKLATAPASCRHDGYKILGGSLPSHLMLVSFIAAIFDVKRFATYKGAICRAEIGEIEISELKSLEIAFLFALDFNLVVSADTYSQITHDLLLFASLREAALCPWRLPHEDQSVAPHAPATQEETTTEPHAPSRCATPEPADREPHAPCSGGAGAAAAGAAALSLCTTSVVAVCLKRDRAPSPPPGPASPERPWSVRRGEGAATAVPSPASQPT